MFRPRPRPGLAALLLALALAACDGAAPETPLGLLTDGRWYVHTVTLTAPDGGPAPPGLGADVPEWLEFGADGVLTTPEEGREQRTPYALSDDGTAITLFGVLPMYVDVLTADELALRYTLILGDKVARVRLRHDRPSRPPHLL